MPHEGEVSKKPPLLSLVWMIPDVCLALTPPHPSEIAGLGLHTSEGEQSRDASAWGDNNARDAFSRKGKSNST